MTVDIERDTAVFWYWFTVCIYCCILFQAIYHRDLTSSQYLPRFHDFRWFDGVYFDIVAFYFRPFTTVIWPPLSIFQDFMTSDGLTAFISILLHFISGHLPQWFDPLSVSSKISWLPMVWRRLFRYCCILFQAIYHSDLTPSQYLQRFHDFRWFDGVYFDIVAFYFRPFTTVIWPPLSIFKDFMTSDGLTAFISILLHLISGHLPQWFDLLSVSSKISWLPMVWRRLFRYCCI